MNVNETRRRSHEEDVGTHNEGLLTKDELAKYLKLTRRGIECLMARRAIPVLKIGKIVRFQIADVVNALKRFEVKEIGRR